MDLSLTPPTTRAPLAVLITVKYLSSQNGPIQQKSIFVKCTQQLAHHLSFTSLFHAKQNLSQKHTACGKLLNKNSSFLTKKGGFEKENVRKRTVSDQLVSVRRSASGHLYADKVHLHNLH